MSRRNIRLRPVRRDEIDLRRFAAAIVALAAAAAREEERAKDPTGDDTTMKEHAA